jgi:amidophosphoribosyltransferase
LQFDCSCFDGKYITNDIDNKYLKTIEALRSDDAKEKNMINENSELIYNQVE